MFKYLKVLLKALICFLFNPISMLSDLKKMQLFKKGEWIATSFIFDKLLGEEYKSVRKHGSYKYYLCAYISAKYEAWKLSCNFSDKETGWRVVTKDELPQVNPPSYEKMDFPASKNGWDDAISFQFTESVAGTPYFSIFRHFGGVQDYQLKYRLFEDEVFQKIMLVYGGTYIPEWRKLSFGFGELSEAQIKSIISCVTPHFVYKEAI